MIEDKWYEIYDTQHLITPALLVFPERIEKNIKMMIAIAGGVKKLRPHVKTYKIAEIIQLQQKYGITKFKCATIAEAELLAICGVKDILLAMQPVGPTIERFFKLISQYVDAEFSTIVDNQQTLMQISKMAVIKNIKASLWMDINNGMNRTGISPRKEAVDLYKTINSDTNLIAKGIHVYDGHIKESNFNLRKKLCDEAFDLVKNLKNNIEKSGIKINTIVAGGTPTFPIHSKREHIEVSPGTTLLWDDGYANLFPDLQFLPSAVLLSRIISKPKTNFVCLDLGHKSVAAEMNFPRVKILGWNDAKQISHSEEHLVIESSTSKEYLISDFCYAIPTHICPTVIKYKEVFTVVNGIITSSWKVAARDNKINI